MSFNPNSNNSAQCYVADFNLSNQANWHQQVASRSGFARIFNVKLSDNAP